MAGRDTTDKKNRKTDIPALICLALSAVIFIIASRALSTAKSGETGAEDYIEYEFATVETVLSDTCETDPSSDGAYRGEQLIIAKVLTGQYRGLSVQAYNFVSPLYGVPVAEGDRVCLGINTYSDGSVRATVYEYARWRPLLVCLALFVLSCVLVGGRTGARSLIGLAVTFLCLFSILLPGLLRGADTVLLTFAVCSFISAVCMIILSGFSFKSLAAFLGTVSGMSFAMIFAAVAQRIARISGLRAAEVEPLLQLRQSGTPIGLKGLLTAGIMIASLGAVMDVAMSIASSLDEIHSVDPQRSSKDLFRSGMNIGRDMVGTMTNTLILAYFGSSFVLVIYLYTLGLSFAQLSSSAYLAAEMISSLSGSIGVILSVPLTAAISSFLYGSAKK